MYQGIPIVVLLMDWSNLYILWKSLDLIILWQAAVLISLHLPKSQFFLVIIY